MPRVMRLVVFFIWTRNFNILGRWENDLGGMKFNYDFLVPAAA